MTVRHRDSEEPTEHSDGPAWARYVPPLRWLPYYQIGWGGMMVEDMIVIRPNGNDCLTHLPRELRRL